MEAAETIFGCCTECEETVGSYGATIDECLAEWALGASDGVHEVKVAEGDPILAANFLPDLTWVMEQVEESISSEVYADDAILESPTKEVEEEFQRVLANFFATHIKQRPYWLFNIRPQKVEVEIKDQKVVGWKVRDENRISHSEKERAK